MDEAQQGLANSICRVSVFINEVLLEHSHIYYVFSLWLFLCYNRRVEYLKQRPSSPQPKIRTV